MTNFDVTARRAISDDLDSVLALGAGIHMGHTGKSLLQRRVLAGECWLAHDGPRVVAYVTVRVQNFFDHDFVELLAVEPRVRRRGVGGRLLAHAVTNSSTPRVFTSTNRSNLAMIALLEKGRWRISGQLEGIDEGDPELVYFIDGR